MMPVSKRDFIASRKKTWEETEKLIRRIRLKGIRSLDEESLLKLGSFYRQASSDLAKARSAEPFGDVTLYLNRLVSNMHAIIYSSEARPIKSFINFLFYDYPNLVRKHSRVIIASALFFLLPALLGYYWMMYDSGSLERYFPSIYQMVGFMKSATDERPAMLASGTINPENMPGASGAIMVNNINVSIMAFATGITFGLLTAYALITNGVLLGAVSYVFLSRTAEYQLYFAAGILPHGVIELTAITFSGGAGFILARSLIMPGNLKRADSLRFHGMDAIRIMYGVAIMLIIAGLIEAFITPIRIENNQNFIDWLKITFSIIIASMLILYFKFAGRRKHSV
jgi:uncharacterized membrane protein SpoIIM required for sporulation